MGELPRNWAVRNLLIRRLPGAVSKTKTKITGVSEVRFEVERKRNPRVHLEVGWKGAAGGNCGLERELGWLREVAHLGGG